jgi:Lar family restriction alleviation protein
MELKRCPFCGGNADVYEAGQLRWVHCHGCGAESDECTSDDAAIAAWNRRTTGDENE